MIDLILVELLSLLYNILYCMKYIFPIFINIYISIKYNHLYINMLILEQWWIGQVWDPGN